MKPTFRLKTRLKEVDAAEIKLTLSSPDTEAGCNVFARIFNDGRLVIDVSRPTGIVEVRVPPNMKVVQ